jgi:CspA family cold shock protein
MSKGRIKRIISERGFGFIETAQGEDLFFHCSKLRGLDFASLHENQLVEFDVAQFPQGIQAVNVRPPDIEQGEPGDGWAVSSPTYGAGARAESPTERGPLTEREALFIRLAVSITRGLEREVQALFDVARQMGIDQSVLSALIERVSAANAEACRAVAKGA